MLDALLCMQIKSCLPFSNSNPQLKPTGIIMSAFARNRMKNWEVIADNLIKAGWSLGYVSAIDSNGRMMADSFRSRNQRHPSSQHPSVRRLRRGMRVVRE